MKSEQLKLLSSVILHVPNAQCPMLNAINMIGYQFNSPAGRRMREIAADANVKGASLTTSGALFLESVKVPKIKATAIVAAPSQCMPRLRVFGEG